MMFAAFPPSSSVSRFPVPASVFWIAFPTSVEPVNAILLTSGCDTSSAPVRPSPVTMFTTPGGSSACRRTSQKSSAVSGVVSAGLSTTVLRAARRAVGAFDVALPGLRDLGERRLARGVDRGVALARCGLDELPANEESVTLLDLDDVSRLGRGGVVPRGRDRGFVGPSRELALLFSQR